MNSKEFCEDLDACLVNQNKVMASYRNRGFVKSKSDEENLHMSFSPYRVPKSLTKLQIRRRINRYKKFGNDAISNHLLSNRLEIFINGKFTLGADFLGNPPQNSRRLNKLIKELVR